MNLFLKNQCQNMRLSITLFEAACKEAVRKDDGVVSKEEEKALKRIHAAAEKFKVELSKIK